MGDAMRNSLEINMNKVDHIHELDRQKHAMTTTYPGKFRNWVQGQVNVQLKSYYPGCIPKSIPPNHSFYEERRDTERPGFDSSIDRR